MQLALLLNPGPGRRLHLWHQFIQRSLPARGADLNGQKPEAVRVQPPILPRNGNLQLVQLTVDIDRELSVANIAHPESKKSHIFLPCL